jgi:outer membrane protein OmpA-like peptidoglycan-associated protein
MARSNQRFWLTATMVAVWALQACSAKTPVSAPAPSDDLDLEAAVTYVAGDIATQLAVTRVRTLAVDPMLDRTSGQQTAASLRAQQALIPAFRLKMSGFVVDTLNATAIDQVGLVATGTVGSTPTAGQFVVNVAVTDRASGIVVAQSAARFRQADLDLAPTRFYGDSPSLVRDRSVDGYLKTAETTKGGQADPLYIEQLPTAALLAGALEAYNAGRWDAALSSYAGAAARQDGQTLRTFNGLYLTNMRLGRTAAAEEAFGKIVGLGLATNNLAVKLLFRPGTTEFLSDPNFSGAYPMWIRQIARAARASDTCLHISGHTSATGTTATNDRLSLARATAVRALLDREAPGLERRSRVSGFGSRRNVVGSGTDDARDAIDRRVEFEVVSCSS